MLPKAIAISTAAVLALSSFVAAAPQNMTRQSPPKFSLTTQLELANTAADRYQLLPNDEDFVFDFGKNNVAMANRQTFPALVGTGSSMAIAEIGACGMASLHVHPRSAELFIVVSGRVYTEMVPESGVLDADGKQRVIRTELGPRMMTQFPMGSFHTQMNPDCKPALTVASFASEDPGASLAAGQVFALSDDFVASTFGQSIAGEDIDTVRDAIPPGALFMVEECIKKCGMQKRQV